MQPPSFFEEQPLVRRNGLLTGQDVIERGDIRAVRMTALHWLIELLRIADQHHGFGCLRNGQHIRKRHLRGLIDKQDIDCVECLRTRP